MPKRLGIGRERKRHALEQLEEAGLASIDRKGLQSPVEWINFIN
jgi:predicted LPLAT superfamily acyltransferase